MRYPFDLKIGLNSDRSFVLKIRAILIVKKVKKRTVGYTVQKYFYWPSLVDFTNYYLETKFRFVLMMSVTSTGT